MNKSRKTFLTIISLLILIYVVAIRIAQPAPDAAFFREPGKNGPLVIAHQGGEEIWPSNTMLAYENAVALGVDVLEMDVHSTADGVLVLIHDATVDRTTDGEGRVNKMTLAEIKQLDAGDYWTDDDGATYPFRGQGVTIPTLEEVFTAFPNMRMNIEIKQIEPFIGAPFCEMIRTFEMEDKVLVASFHKEAMKDFRKACPEVATSTYEEEVIALYVWKTLLLEGVHSPKATAVQVPEYRSNIHILTPRFVQAAHNRNLDVHVWTVNDPADMQRFIDMGIDGIITDRPDLLLELLEN